MIPRSARNASEFKAKGNVQWCSSRPCGELPILPFELGNAKMPSSEIDIPCLLLHLSCFGILKQSREDLSSRGSEANSYSAESSILPLADEGGRKVPTD